MHHRSFAGMDLGNFVKAKNAMHIFIYEVVIT